MLIELIQSIEIGVYVCIIAGMLGLALLKQLHSSEKLIVLIIWVNIISEIIATKYKISGIPNGVIYNISTPIEQMITIFLYSFGMQSRKFHLGSILLIFLLAASNYGLIINPYDFNYYTFIVSGILIAIFSYWKLKLTIHEMTPWRSVMLWFSIANLIYYSLIVSSLGALPLANDISIELALSFYAINDVGYIIWSVLIAIGILWNKKKNT